MRHRLVIIGAGEFGREVFCWASQVPESQRDWDVGGFLDRDPKKLDAFRCPVGILGDASDYEIHSHDRFLCAIAKPEIRKKVVESMEARGAIFETLIHPAAVVGFENRIGAGTIICPGAVVSTNVTIGRHVHVNYNSTVGHDATLSDYCTLSGGVDITGHVILEEGVFLGSRASILPNVVIGKYAIIGAGSVVLHSADSFTTVFGVPAKTMSRREPPDGL